MPTDNEQQPPQQQAPAAAQAKVSLTQIVEQASGVIKEDVPGFRSLARLIRWLALRTIELRREHAALAGRVAKFEAWRTELQEGLLPLKKIVEEYAAMQQGSGAQGQGVVLTEQDVREKANGTSHATLASVPPSSDSADIDLSPVPAILPPEDR